MAVLPLGPLPVGFRFHPTDEELVNHYLKRKIAGRIRSGADDVIPEVDVCRCEPWDLPGKSVIRSEDPEWFFFSPRDRKYPKGLRHNRATVAGYWKATGKDRQIKSRGGGGGGGGRVLVGMKKTLVFHLGRAPKGDRTNWIMHEYRTTEPEYESGCKGSFVLCRLFRKSEETLPSSNADEMDGSDFSPTLTRSSPSETQQGEDAPEESTAPVNQVLSETKLQENSQPVVLPANNQSVGSQSCLDGTAVLSAPCPSKQEESHSGSIITYNVVDDTARVEDDLAKLLGPEYGQLNPDDFLQNSSPEPQSYCQFSDHFDKGLSVGISEVDGTEQDSDTEFLDALLSNQEDDFAELLTVQNLVSKAPEYDVCCPELDSSWGWGAAVFPGPVRDGSCDSASCKDSGSSSNSNIDAALAQKDPGLETTGQFDRPLFSPSYSQMNISNENRERLPPFNATRTVRPEESMQENAQLTEKPIYPQKLTGSGVSHDFSTQTEERTGEASHIGPSINIRARPMNYLRSKNVLQGSTKKRLILQISAADKESINSEDKHDLNLTESKIADDVMLQTAEEIEVSDPHLDELDSFSDYGDIASLEIKPVFQQDSEELMPAVRLRRKSTSVTGNGLRGQSLPLGAPRCGSILVIRIVVVSMLIFLLACGGIYCYLNLCTGSVTV